jgi:uncharacterized membrane protein YesL
MDKTETPAHIQVLKQAFFDWWDAWVDLLVVNLLYILCWLTIILGPPATFGLYYIANRLAHGENPGPAGLLQGGRRYFFLSWLWLLLNLVVALIVGLDLWFYTRFEGLGGAFLQALFILLALVWLIVQFYALPYLMEQEQKNLGLALRNGLLTALAAPVYTAAIAGVALIVAALSLGLVAPLLLGGPALIATLGTRAVLERVETFRVRERDAARTEPKPEEAASDKGSNEG